MFSMVRVSVSVEMGGEDEMQGARHARPRTRITILSMWPGPAASHCPWTVYRFLIRQLWIECVSVCEGHPGPREMRVVSSDNCGQTEYKRRGQLLLAIFPFLDYTNENLERLWGDWCFWYVGRFWFRDSVLQQNGTNVHSGQGGLQPLEHMFPDRLTSRHTKSTSNNDVNGIAEIEVFYTFIIHS